MTDPAYASAGVDSSSAERAVARLVAVLATIDPGRPSRTALRSGHYANVLALDDRIGIALSTDGVGSKVIVAEQLQRFDTVGVDCIAMNVNDVICVGAEPLAVLDYIAVESAQPELLEAVGVGLKRGAEAAGVEIPGGELAQLPELIRGHPSPYGFDLVGACFGTVALDAIVSGESIAAGDMLIGLPSSGIHSNGLTLARRALPDLAERPPELAGRGVGEELLTPTTIYVKAIRELLSAAPQVNGLAHITSGGMLNLLRLNARVGYTIDAPLEAQPIFGLIAARAGVDAAEMHEVFNMGCGFCVVVAPGSADAALEVLARHHPGVGVIGHVEDRAGKVTLARSGLVGRSGGFGR